MSANFERIVAKLTNAKWTGQEFTARCPAHDDQRSSLTVKEADDGKILFHCFAGCDTAKIVAALGLQTGDLFAAKQARPSKLGNIVKTYDYRDEDGHLLYQAVRFEPKDFRQRQPNGAGDWTWKMEGVRYVLYHLPEIRQADPAQPVFVVEGEKDADNLAGLGLLATTNVGGAGKWRPEYSAPLQGRRVVILPDNDEPGAKHGAPVVVQN